MGNFRRDGDRGFGGDRGSRGRFGGGRDRPQMHDVVCDKCGKNCQVPFKPSGDKPVLCSECFGKERDNDRGSRSSSSSGGVSQAQFKELNSKVDKILKILENIEFEEEGEEDELVEAGDEEGEEVEVVEKG
jgi:CxxC-x17-CxxC domain-containing protein